MEKDRILSDLMNVTVECADAKVVAETLQMTAKVTQSEMLSLRHQLDTLQAAAGRVRSFSDVSGGSQLAATLHLSEQLESDTEPVIKRTSETTDALLKEISRLTDSIDIKDETIRLLQIELVEAKRSDSAVLDESRGSTGQGFSRGSRGEGNESQYKELFASSEAEMSRLKVNKIDIISILYLIISCSRIVSILFFPSYRVCNIFFVMQITDYFLLYDILIVT